MNLDEQFARIAMRPVHVACRHFDESDVHVGVRQLSADALDESLELAIRSLSQRTSASVEVIRASVPASERRLLLRSLREGHTAAVTISEQLVGCVWSVIPASGTKPNDSAGVFLGLLAEKYSLDTHIAEPMKAFAADLCRWEKLVAECAAAMAANDETVRAWRRKKIIRVSIAATLVALSALALGLSARAHARARAARDRQEALERRVELALTQPNPCLVLDLSPEDIHGATADQAGRLERQNAACAVRREHEAYEQRCEALASHVESNTMNADDLAIANQAGELLRRIASGTLQPTDIETTPGPMPCQDTPSGRKLWLSYATAASRAASTWGALQSASPELVSAMASATIPLSRASEVSLSVHADAVSVKAIRGGKREELIKAKKICEIQKAFRLELGSGCRWLTGSKAAAILTQ